MKSLLIFGRNAYMSAKFILRGSILLASLLYLGACNNDSGDTTDPSLVVPGSGVKPPASIPYTLIAQYPHDTSAYTQGLEFYKGKLLESTGDFENSSLRITDAKTGRVEKINRMGTPEIFAEGITVLNDKIYQLTWESNIAYVYDVNDISKPIHTFDWPYQGWGITNNGTDLIISDGTTKLYFVDPATFTVKNIVSVQDNNGSVSLLNELEYIDGFVYANVYLSYLILKIDPASGHVVGKMTLPDLLTPTEKIIGRTDVLNGIAWDSSANSMFITGKRWPKMFELKLQ